MEAQPRVRRLVVNRAEELADHVIGKAVAADGDRLSLKSRLADVIDVQAIPRGFWG